MSLGLLHLFPVPLCYDLGIRDDGIIIKIHRTAVKYLLAQISKNSPIIVDLRERLGLPEFIFPNSRLWGFGNTISTDGENGDWITWKCELPTARNFGTKAFAISATLNVIFNLLRNCEITGDTNQTQLLAINSWMTLNAPHGGFFSVILSSSLCEWISQRGYYYKEEIDAAMVAAYKRMTYKKDRLACKNSIGVQFDGRHTMFFTEGNACSLNPEGGALNESGDKLMPHNVDLILQQLVLFAGVAKLNQLAREDINTGRT